MGGSESGCGAQVTRPARRGTGMPASACPITATAAFVALLVIGCGTTTNGLEERSGTEVLDAATAAIDGASGVHVTGTGISGGRPAASPAGSCTRREVCGEYDEGAQCFATAAGIGIPFPGTAANENRPRCSTADSLLRVASFRWSTP
jgi:hypothetical protein